MINKVTYGSDNIFLIYDSSLSNVLNFCFYLFCCNQKEKDHIRRKINSKNKNIYLPNQYYYFNLPKIRVDWARITEN